MFFFGRPDYKKLCVLKERYPKVPTMALTATATPRVRFDILKQLAMKNPKWYFVIPFQFVIHLESIRDHFGLI